MSAVAACARGPPEDRCSEFGRTVVVGVQDDQYSAIGVGLAGGQVDVPLQFVFLEEAVALYPNRSWHVRYDVGNGGGSDASNQDRYGIHFARPFHYRDDR